MNLISLSPQTSSSTNITNKMPRAKLNTKKVQPKTSSLSPLPAKKRELDQASKQDYSASWHFSDVVLNVEGQKFHVHRSTLSMWSPVFETMFTSEFKEKTSPEIPLPGKRVHEIQALLDLLYSRKGQVQQVTGMWSYVHPGVGWGEEFRWKTIQDARRIFYG